MIRHIFQHEMVVLFPSHLIAHKAPRKSHTTQPTAQRYCSDRCRREKLRRGPSTDTDIETAFVRLLGDGRERRIVSCEEVEREVFTATRRGTEEEKEEEEDNDGRIGPFDVALPGEEGESGDGDESEDEDGGVRLHCPVEHHTATTITATDTNFMRPKMEGGSLMTNPRERGMQKAKERELVRRAARRGVAFGFEMEEGGRRRRVEAVQGGRLVESSFAKGDWGVRWI